MKASVSGGIAIVAVVVGLSSVVAGQLQVNAANHKVCYSADVTNAAVRGLIEDFTLSNPDLTQAQRDEGARLTRLRFPDLTC